MSIKDLLKRKKDELNEWRESITGTAIICSFVIIPLLVITPIFAFSKPLEASFGPMEGWLKSGAHPMGMSIGVTMVTIIAILTLVGPIFLVPMGIDLFWKLQQRRISRILHDTDLPVLIIDDTALAPLWNTLAEQPLLRLVASQRPRSIDQRIEFCSDYWRAVLAVQRGQHKRLKLEIFWGNATRLIDDTAPLVYNGCVSLILLTFLAPFMLVVGPLWAFGIYLCIQQQACQAAMVDYFIDNPTLPGSKNDNP